MEIYNSNNVNLLLGVLCHKPSLILDTRYPLKVKDFECNLFQKIIFGVIHNLALKGAKNVGIIEISEFLDNYQTQKEIFNDNDGAQYLETIIELTEDKIENIELYWVNVRKHTLIREYKEKGFSIDWIWNDEKSFEYNESILENKTIDEIIKHYECDLIEIKKEFVRNDLQEEYVAGTDFAEIKELFKQIPLLGTPFQSEYLSEIYNGILGLLLTVGKSGGGKTVSSIGNLMYSSALEYWDRNEQKFVTNKHRVGEGLFINTEMDIRNQLDPLMIAWIADVERSHIIRGQYEKGEEERVDYAKNILLESGIYVVDDPLFTIDSLENSIKEYSLKYNLGLVVFDYIQNNITALQRMNEVTGLKLQEWAFLLQTTAELKRIQMECGISLLTSVQSNGNEDNTPYPNESCLAGSKAQTRKTDGCYALFPPTKKELKDTELLLDRKGFGGHIKPNTVAHIIKGRNSKYEKNIKVFQYLDMGTGRSYDLFCTNKDNEPIKVNKLDIIGN